MTDRPLPLVRAVRLPKVMTHVGFWLAIAIWSASGWRLSEQILFHGDFTVVASLRECEQPLNNRCRDVYRLREADGDEHVETLVNFPVRPVVGSHIQKEKYAMSYRVDGRATALTPDSTLTLASLLALLSFEIAVHWALSARRP